MKHQVIAMKKHAGGAEIEGIKFKMELPEGCTGMLLCFESKKAARKYWGEDAELMRFEEEQIANEERT